VLIHFTDVNPHIKEKVARHGMGIYCKKKLGNNSPPVKRKTQITKNKKKKK
jgi:hypothetical protein